MPASGRQKAGVTQAGVCLLRCPSGCLIEIEPVIHDADFRTRRVKNASQVWFGGVSTQGQVRQQPNLIDAMTHDAVS